MVYSVKQYYMPTCFASNTNIFLQVLLFCATLFEK